MGFDNDISLCTNPQDNEKCLNCVRNTIITIPDELWQSMMEPEFEYTNGEFICYLYWRLK